MKAPPAEAVAIGLLLVGRIAFLLASPAGLFGDAFNYFSAAQVIVSTGRLPPLAVQPHGYALLISPLLLLGAEKIASSVLLMNVCMDTAVVLLLTFLAWRLFASPCGWMVRFFACTALVVQPFTAEMVGAVYTEQPCIFFVFFGVCALIRLVSSKNSHALPVIGPLLLGFAALMRIDLLVLNLPILVFFLWLQNRQLLNFVRKAAVSLALYAALPILMLAFQYHSSGEIGIIRTEQHHPGYLAWMRTWFSFEKQHDKFAFDRGDNKWEGFEPANYPERAFDAAEERKQIALLLSRWRADGYSESIDRGFAELANQRLRARPLYGYVLVPSMRMLHFWFNIDGAQTFLRVVHLHRPLSTMVVAFTLLLKLSFNCLALVGIYFVWENLRRGRSGDKWLELGRLSLVAALLRTFELGALGLIAGGGLMEVRYILVAFPFLIILSLIGGQFLMRNRAHW